MIRILIVDDSATEIAILKHIFQSAPDIQVIGFAKEGKEAVRMTQELSPDLITMDIHMPRMNGFEAIQLIMSQCPTPIVVISSKVNELNTTFLSLEAGALSVLEKPADINSPSFAQYKNHVIKMIRSMAEIKVIKRRFLTTKTIKPKKNPIIPAQFFHRNFEIIAIGTSVGGPEALKTILSKLPKTFPVPIVIVQHMTVGFMEGFTKWLDEQIPLKVKCAEDHEVICAGTVYFAPDQHHLEVVKINDKLVAHLTKDPPISGFCPSATVLLTSVAKCSESHAVGILLTGMGNDGADGLLALKKAEGLTLIQDEKSAVVFGMAGVAQSLGAVDKVIKLDEFSDYLVELFSHHKIKEISE